MPGKPGQQCVYDGNGKLITHGPGAGTVDKAGPGASLDGDHLRYDVEPYHWALELDGSDSKNPDSSGEYYRKYMEKRPPNKGKDANGKPCQENP